MWNWICNVGRCCLEVFKKISQINPDLNIQLDSQTQSIYGVTDVFRLGFAQTASLMHPWLQPALQPRRMCCGNTNRRGSWNRLVIKRLLTCVMPECTLDAHLPLTTMCGFSQNITDTNCLLLQGSFSWPNSTYIFWSLLPSIHNYIQTYQQFRNTSLANKQTQNFTWRHLNQKWEKHARKENFRWCPELNIFRSLTAYHFDLDLLYINIY